MTAGARPAADENRPSSTTTRRDFLLGAALMGTAGLAYAASAFNQPRPLIAGGLGPVIPEAAGRWRSVGTAGLVLPPEGELSRSTYDEVLTRVYSSEGAPPIMLVMAYGGNQSGNMQLHRPEACYPAAGFVLGEPRDVTIEAAPQFAIAARAIEAVAPSRTEQILYWTRIGTSFPLTPSSQRWSVIRDNLRGTVPDGVLVRVSSIMPDAEDAFSLLTDFIRSLIGAAPAEGRRLMIGR
jgi:EpsI family protein